MSLAIALAELCFDRPGFRLGPLSFAVPAGGRLAVVGPSGSGKSTLLRCLAGLERPSGGALRFGDRVVAGPGAFVPPDQRRVGLVFQDGALWPHLTALQHLRFAAPGRDLAALRALLAQGGLAHLERRKPAAMSGGEAQRLGLLRALAADPAVLLLDEPLRSVDVHQRDALVLLLRGLADARGLTTVLVTHDRDEALALATDLVVLRDGQVCEQGPALQLLRAPRTAFTAAFLAGAACLPTAAADPASVDTPFGRLPRPAGAAGDLRLVLLPGDAALAPDGAAGGPRGRILAVLPAEVGYVAKVGLGDQLVHAHADAPAPVGSEVPLRLRRPPRLLPWDLGPNPSAASPS